LSALTRSRWFGNATVGPLLIYVLLVLVVGWLGYSVQALGEEGSAVSAPFAGLRVLMGFGWTSVALLAIGLLPAMALTRELVARQQPSRLARFALGAASWEGWGALVVATAAVARTVVLDAATVAGALVILALSGGLFAEFALRRAVPRPGPVVALVAVAIVVVVLAGEVLTAGRWGSAV
jgi:hypothetical protein